MHPVAGWFDKACESSSSVEEDGWHAESSGREEELFVDVSYAAAEAYGELYGHVDGNDMAEHPYALRCHNHILRYCLSLSEVLHRIRNVTSNSGP